MTGARLAVVGGRRLTGPRNTVTPKAGIGWLMTKQKRAARTRTVQAGRRIYRRWRTVAREAADESRFLVVDVELRWTPDLTLTVLRTQQAMRDELVREGMRVEPIKRG